MSRVISWLRHPYLVEFGLSMIAYVAVLVFVVAGRPQPDGYTGAMQWLELLPVLPLIGACWAMARQYLRSDEFFQRIQAEAFALGAMIWGIVMMAWGFAENAGLPPLSTIWVAPGLLISWGVVTPFIVKRYT